MGILSDLLDVKESYRLPDILMQTLLNDEARSELFRQIKRRQPGMSFDFLRDEYQEEHGDRKK